MANGKLTNFKDLKVEYPERYKVINEDLTEETKTIRFLPGVTYQEGTPETAENFNNIQRNSIYEVNGTRITEGQNEIYNIVIEGSEDFTFTDLKLCLVPNETNTKKGPLIRFNGNTYTIKNAQDTVNIGSLVSKEKIFLNLNFTQKTAEIIGVLTGGTHRTIKQLDTDNRANAGIPYDPEIEYIQDVGTKKANFYYKDKNQEGLFKCKENSTTTTNLSNIFEKFDNNELLNRLRNLSIFKTNVLTPVLTASSDPNAKVGDVYLAVATSGGEKEIFDSKIIIIPFSRLITSCKMNIFQGTVNVTYDGTIWRWNREGTDVEGEIKVYKLHLFL
ncbi:hypothetical protein [uncultured Clostridium sp.]|uniref:hypothetical protein n=1 Tax=uncultured Clostridium sp. TaxID=59620 RepID=UPI002613E0F1|nr:hypothetical protein [uncultured Clostridium sp.]